MSDKIKISQWVINIIVALLFTAYAWIFSTTITRIEKVEAKIENVNPILLQIQTDIAGIKTDLEWIKIQIIK